MPAITFEPGECLLACVAVYETTQRLRVSLMTRTYLITYFLCLQGAQESGTLFRFRTTLNWLSGDCPELEEVDEGGVGIATACVRASTIQSLVEPAEFRGQTGIVTDDESLGVQIPRFLRGCSVPILFETFLQTVPLVESYCVLNVREHFTVGLVLSLKRPWGTDPSRVRGVNTLLLPGTLAVERNML